MGQAVSVSVAVLTLSFIALDRWYAICHPLLFKSTARRARGSILGIWAVSLAVMVPQAAVMECSSVLPELANRTRLFSVCDEHWAGNGGSLGQGLLKWAPLGHVPLGQASVWTPRGSISREDTLERAPTEDTFRVGHSSSTYRLLLGLPPGWMPSDWATPGSLCHGASMGPSCLLWP